MSEDGEDDLSGRWHGFYNMPDDSPSNGFEAEIRDQDGAITGLTSETGDTPDCYGMQLQAVIEGHRRGSSVEFTKFYDYLERPDPVHYSGAIQAGGDEIEGVWTIPGVWSGTFLMVRAGKTADAIERKVSEEVR